VESSLDDGSQWYVFQMMGMKSYRKQQTHNTQTQQASAHLSDGAVVDLLSVAKTSKKESHAKDEKQIGQDGAKERSLYDADLILDQCNDKNDQLDSISKGNVEECTEGVTKTTGNTLSGVTEQASERYDGDSVHSEDNGRAQMRSFGRNADGYEYQQHVDPAVADSILSVDDKALASLDSAGSHGRFGCRGGFSAISGLYGGISIARSFGLDLG
jgi:hypothetical protein